MSLFGDLLGGSLVEAAPVTERQYRYLARWYSRWVDDNDGRVVRPIWRKPWLVPRVMQAGNGAERA